MLLCMREYEKRACLKKACSVQLWSFLETPKNLLFPYKQEMNEDMSDCKLLKKTVTHITTISFTL
jgi:hypothetical protein